MEECSHLVGKTICDVWGRFLILSWPDVTTYLILLDNSRQWYRNHIKPSFEIL